MTIATPDLRSPAQAETESHEPVGVLGHSARRGSVSFERPAPGHYLAVEEGELTRLIPLRGAVTHVGRGFSADLRQRGISPAHLLRVIPFSDLHSESVRWRRDRWQFLPTRPDKIRA